MHMVLKWFLSVDSKQCMGAMILMKKTEAVGFKRLKAVCSPDSGDLKLRPGAFLWLKEADLGAWGRLRKLFVTRDWSRESRAGKAQLHAEGFL